MDRYEVKELKYGENFRIKVTVPGSKSITNRALLLAALSNGKVKLCGTLFSDDSRHFIKALTELGFEVDIDEELKMVTVKGEGGCIPNNNVTIDVGAAGTAARFLTAMLAMSGGNYTITSSEQMKKRPMKPLLCALEKLGVNITYLEQPYHLPIIIEGIKECDTDEIELDTDESTQYLSAMLMIAPTLDRKLKIKVTGSRKTGSYVNITRNMMMDFGCDIIYDGDVYTADGCSGYNVPDEGFYQIEPDMSAACYFYALGAILGCRAIVKNVHFNISQGDIKFLRVLENMGCILDESEEGIVLTPPSDGVLQGITVDMKDFSDQALTMAAVAIFANSPSIIINIGHIRKQESDRLLAMSNALCAMGIKNDVGEESIKIYPSDRLKKCEIETYEDHRVAMSFTLPGVKYGNVTILNPMCCAKTFENFYDIIDSLY